MTAAMNKDVMHFGNKDAVTITYLGTMAGCLAQIADALNKMAGIKPENKED